MSGTLGIFGYKICERCQAPVLNEIAFKTRGLCSECFRTSPVLETIIAVTKDRERVALKVGSRSAGDKAQRARAKKRALQRDDQRERRNTAMLAKTRAWARLARVFPEIYEVILADERARLGLEAWSIERALTPHQVTDKTMALLASYHALDKKAN